MTRLEQYRVIRQGPKVWNQWRRDNPPSLPDLSELKYREAELSGANLRTGANLTRAKFAHTIFGDTNLTGALGLDACDHEGPSILAHSTLVRSGQLPLSFLWGCGLPTLSSNIRLHS